MRDDTGLVGYDADRYGPALPLVVELVARAQQLDTGQGARADQYTA